eukprot:CAMPEP_0181208588 /NCGR_PEP_ID=MMETSP1096-20121128/22202_1 /TAXON_ID=156174 ORGANISM="Chrysochromulina ericina, Strain CCMP281" /NCGR_SAMPLE_ID=MMETSP1096 /ASSEMBLY_ACC=CAM_ASM_000453 /LENGTH=56 /DNA_ID=CAMNT_0023299671 /DNA_START=449 /DNA_END=619 /DNA_ORIENTATION=-
MTNLRTIVPARSPHYHPRTITPSPSSPHHHAPRRSNLSGVRLVELVVDLGPHATRN